MRKTPVLAISGALLAGGLASAALFRPSGADAQTSSSTPGSSSTAAPDDRTDDNTAKCDKRGGRDRHGRGHAGMGERLETLAASLGVTADELKAQLRDGKTVAEIAEANDVDLDSLIDDLAEAMITRLDAAVERGRITRERADEIAAQLRDRITARVNGEMPEGGRGRGFGRSGPHHGHDDTGDDTGGDTDGDTDDALSA